MGTIDRAWGMGHWELGIGHWALGINHLTPNSCTDAINRVS
ncbi:hypothetical protein [Nostoc sp.]